MTTQNESARLNELIKKLNVSINTAEQAAKVFRRSQKLNFSKMWTAVTGKQAGAVLFLIGHRLPGKIEADTTGILTERNGESVNQHILGKRIQVTENFIDKALSKIPQHEQQALTSELADVKTCAMSYAIAAYEEKFGILFEAPSVSPPHMAQQPVLQQKDIAAGPAF